MAIEGITGLKINYWAMVNLQGFRDLVDAVGGVTLNVRQPIPVGGLGSDVTGYIEPGERKLDGHDVLWFARAREGSDDYSRMARQKCVMGAMLRQISPQTARQELRGDRQRVVGDDLHQHPAERGRPLHLAGPRRPRPEDLHVSLVPPMIVTADPDIPTVRRMVNTAIARAEGRTPAEQPEPTSADPVETPVADGGTPVRRRSSPRHAATTPDETRPSPRTAAGRHRRLGRQPVQRLRRQPDRRPGCELLIAWWRGVQRSLRPDRASPGARPPQGRIRDAPGTSRVRPRSSRRVNPPRVGDGDAASPICALVACTGQSGAKTCAVDEAVRSRSGRVKAWLRQRTRP